MPAQTGPIEIGVISDTHGLVRPEALRALRGVSTILHAGDIGKPEVLEQLATIAPVQAIRGNVDVSSSFREVPLTKQVRVGGRIVYLVHNIADLDIDPTGVDVIVYGHSHNPEISQRDGTLFLNPGSAGPRRFHLPIALARLRLGPRTREARIVELAVSPDEKR